MFDGYNPSRFCYSKILFQQHIEFWFFHGAKTSFVIATDTVLHFNHLCMPRPNKRKVLCWQIFHIVDAFHATSANFTQRRITLRVQTKRKVTRTNRNIHFQNTKIRNKDPATVRIRRKKNYFIAIFTKKQTSDKVYRFSDK